jgi:hypothetical protein
MTINPHRGPELWGVYPIREHPCKGTADWRYSCRRKGALSPQIMNELISLVAEASEGVFINGMTRHP